MAQIGFCRYKCRNYGSIDVYVRHLGHVSEVPDLKPVQSANGPEDTTVKRQGMMFRESIRLFVEISRVLKDVVKCFGISNP